MESGMQELKEQELLILTFSCGWGRTHQSLSIGINVVGPLFRIRTAIPNHIFLQVPIFSLCVSWVYAYIYLFVHKRH